jgi:hypothetical protein
MVFIHQLVVPIMMVYNSSYIKASYMYGIIADFYQEMVGR